MNSLNIEIPEGAKVLVKTVYLRAGNEAEEARTFVCELGFGMKPFTSGTAIFGKWTDGTGKDRIEGYMIEKIIVEPQS